MTVEAGWLDALGPDRRADLAREYFLAGHLIDRVGMPHVIGALGRDIMAEVAIEEWSGASPVYTGRMQRAMGFEGDDIATIFKGMQFDIGAPPEFLDFRFEVDDDTHGRFHLDHCGALVDVEPMGEDYVVAMCHHIEDPTFDATAAATNPRARMRPVHRPPRVPADRRPHCEWIVDIDASRPAVPYPAAAAQMSRTLAAGVDLDPGRGPFEPAPVDGRVDYSGPFDPDLRFDDFTDAALGVICSESALQGHLLAMSFAAAVARQGGVELARDLLDHQLVGWAGLSAGRLAAAGDFTDDLEGVAAVLTGHPLLAPRGYVAATVEFDPEAVRVEVHSCAAVRESVPSWIGVLVEDGVDVVASIAESVDPRARVGRCEPGAAVAAWEITRGESPADVRGDVALGRMSSGSEFVFRRIGRRPRP